MSDLLAINVSEHIEKKGALSYLSWAWAWAEVLKIDPAASWNVVEYNNMPCMFLPDGSAMVRVYVSIKGDVKSCVLPVMDNRNNAVKNPDSRKISDAIMRCLAKGIAMHGLGLYIYAGEDLPMVEAQATPEEAERAKRGAELEELAMYLIDCHKMEKDLDAIRIWYDPKTWAEDQSVKNDEQVYVWGLLKTESKLRSTIKSNKPA